MVTFCFDACKVNWELCENELGKLRKNKHPQQLPHIKAHAWIYPQHNTNGTIHVLHFLYAYWTIIELGLVLGHYC